MKYYNMGSGLSTKRCKVHKTTAVEIFDEEEAKVVKDVSLVKFSHEGREFKVYFKPISNRRKM